MIDLHPLIWAAIFVLLLIAIFELVRLGRVSGTFSLAGGISVVGILDYIGSLNITDFLGTEAVALMTLVMGVMKGYTRWRTGDVVRPAPNLIGTGHGGSRSLTP